MELDLSTASASEIWEALGADAERRDRIIRGLDSLRIDAEKAARAKGTREERFVGRLLEFAGKRGKPDDQGYRYFLIWYAKTHGERGGGLRRGKRSSAPESDPSRRVAALLRARLRGNELETIDAAIRHNWDSAQHGTSIKQMASEWRREFINDFLSERERNEYKDLIRSVLPPIWANLRSLPWRNRHPAGAHCLGQLALLGLAGLIEMSRVPDPAHLDDSRAPAAGAPPHTTSQDLSATPDSEQAACFDTAKALKRCLLAMARRLRPSNYESARDAYEVAAGIDYDSSHENVEDTLTALLELTSLHVSRKDFRSAYASYARYLGRRPPPGSTNDCRMLFALASRAFDDEHALALRDDCRVPPSRVPGRRPEPIVATWAPQMDAPSCHLELKEGLVLERLHRDLEAIRVYAGALTEFLRRGDEELRRESQFLVENGWDGLGCENDSRGAILAQVRSVSERLSRQGQLLRHGTDTIALTSYAPRSIEVWTAVFDPGAYGCGDTETPIVVLTSILSVNANRFASVPPPGPLHLLLKPGRNRITVRTAFVSSSGSRADTTCNEKTEEISFCWSPTGIAAADQCPPT